MRNLKIILIRHGESSHNQNGNQLSGLTDVSLTQNGIDQCKQLSIPMQLFGIQAVFTSPLTRAINSAKLIFPNFEPIINPGLIEFDYGNYEGIAAANNRTDPVIIQWDNNPGRLTFPGGGNIGEHAQNAYDTLSEIARNCNQETIACISHKTTIRLLVSKILGLDLNYFRRVPCANCSITEIEFAFPNNFNITSVNVSLVL